MLIGSFNQRFLKFGGLIESKENEADKMSVDGAGGGVIALISSDGVINNGSMECKASDHNLFSGGTIMISTDGRFENNGFIECGPGGVVTVECAEFEDNGTIRPRVDVVIGTNFNFDSKQNIKNKIRSWIQGMSSRDVVGEEMERICLKRRHLS